MTSSPLKHRFVQLTCLLLQAVVLYAFAYFLVAVVELSNKGFHAPGMTLKDWSDLAFALVIASALYWAVGRVRDRAARQLRSTLPDSELRTPSSELR